MYYRIKQLIGVTDSVALKQCSAWYLWIHYVSGREMYFCMESTGTDSVSSGPEDPD